MAFLLAAGAAAELDIAELAREHARMLERGEQDAAANVAILVSFSMPQASLQQLVHDAAQASVPLVLRGLHAGSMRATQRMIARFDPARRALWQIDPRLFRKYDVQAVPLFAASKGADDAVVRGDVSLAYALGKLAADDSAAGAYAGKMLSRMQAELSR